MLVKELIEELKKQDPEKKVYIPAVKHGHNLYEVREGKHPSTKGLVVLR